MKKVRKKIEKSPIKVLLDSTDIKSIIARMKRVGVDEYKMTAHNIETNRNYCLEIIVRKHKDCEEE